MKCLYLAQLKTVDELIEILDRKKKPFTNNEIQIILKEARQIATDYGNQKKRIGNGHSHGGKIKNDNVFTGKRDNDAKVEESLTMKPKKKVKTDQTTVNKKGK